ncbi:hypothetical protein DRN34_03805 [Thermococci archaeon]|nr:MAG: hypothetical protein DRN34_03805 [Thermococci archaeon]
MQEMRGNILNITSGIICHQVNCCGVMGAGLALDIRNKWPVVANDYFARHNSTGVHLGDIIISHVDKVNDLYVASLAGQDQFGKGVVFTKYNALRMCLAKVNYWNGRKHVIYIPVGMSCGLAGGDWDTVVGIIAAVVPDAVLVKYGVL